MVRGLIAFSDVEIRVRLSLVLVAHIERGRDEVQRQEHGEEESADYADAAAGPDFVADAPPKPWTNPAAAASIIPSGSIR